MKKSIFIAIAACFLCSCASLKLSDTVWFNVAPAELDGEQVKIVSSVYFLDEETIAFNESIMQDDSVIIAPYFVAHGTYSCKRETNKRFVIDINAHEVAGDSIQYNGVIVPEGMILVSSDSIMTPYRLASNLTLKTGE